MQANPDDMQPDLGGAGAGGAAGESDAGASAGGAAGESDAGASPGGGVANDPAAQGSTGESGAPDWLDKSPDGWREAIAGEDEALLNTLKRHNNLRSALKSGWEAQQKIRRGEVSNGLPDDPTDEQLAAWREANGVPESPDKYDLQIEEGLVLGDADRRIMESVQAAAHEANVPAGTLSRLTNAVLSARQEEAEALQAQDGLHLQQAERQLKEAWGQDYNTNVNLAKMFLAQFPESVRDELASARLAGGRALFNSPEVMNTLTEMMRTVAPAATVVPNANNPVQSINDEIAKLEARMGDREWFKDDAAQKRYRELLDARDRMK
jgi:hypothetical protein